MVGAALERILASRGFAASPRQQGFLRFIVEETLAGRAGRVKEYAIALEVFERDESFDPRANSLVRVEAGRLRGKLRDYYADEGRDDAVIIEIPTGTYVPGFSSKETTPTDEASSVPAARRRRAGLTAIAVAAVFVLLSYLALERLGDAPPAPGWDGETQPLPTVAVLPLTSLSTSPDERYFSAGMTEALKTGLARRARLRVISLGSTIADKDADRPHVEIARAHGVDHLVEGSVLRAAGRVRVTARLIEVAGNRQLWAESYERDLADIIALQADVAARIAAALPGAMGIGAKTPAAPPGAVDPAAEEAYLKGLYFRNQMTRRGFEKGLTYFTRAIERAPDHARAYSGLATCFCLMGGHGFEIVAPGEGMPQARDAVLAALRLEPELAEPHAFLGIIRLKFDWDFAGAEESFRRAIELNPSYPQARIFYSFFLEAMGQRDAAVREAATARMLDPLSLQANVNLGWQYLKAGRLDDARRQFELTREIAPEFWGVYWGLGHYHRKRGALDEAAAAFRRAVAIGGGHALPIADLGYTEAVAGNAAAAREALAKLQDMAGAGYVSPYTLATVHVGLGELEQAFAYLEEAYRDRSRSLAWLNVAEEYDGLRGDPRLESLVKRVGLAP